ncbi:hypothetical protein PInf_025533 [Phytophthora infestans]|nr:hypothetical protein PInf_025533 [Phytophthora infestans]
MERVEDGSSMNVVPPMFHAGISNKFTKRHHGNFRDTTLTAASAAKERAERKLERQANAIEKQQQKIDDEMMKITEITQNLHRQQLREAKRLRNRLNYAASRVQAAYRRHQTYVDQQKREAAVCIQTLSRGFLARRLSGRLRLQRQEHEQNLSSEVIARCIRRCSARNIRAKEITRRYSAACSIQSIVRMIAARSYVQEERGKRHEAERQHRAAVVIQCNARSFMTRLIYLDVLYLICRIQAAMRGCLVRRQLRWLRISDVDAIAKLQAHVRGLLTRMRMEKEQEKAHTKSVPTSRSHSSVLSSRQADSEASKQKLDGDRGRIGKTRAASFSVASHDKLGRALVRSATGLGWQPTVEPAIKRSYWLPAGASFDKRLPVLPVPKRMLALDRGDPFEDDLRLINQTWTPKKRPHQKPCPARLSPVVILSSKSDVDDPSSTDDDGVLEKEERLRRQEELKQKMLLRRAMEKRQQELELRLKREAENEKNERNLMEREEKAVFAGVQERGKFTADQRREERDRLAMAREERHIRLHIKFCARQKTRRRQIAATTSESESQPPSTSSSRRELLSRRKSSAAKSRKAESVPSKGGEGSSEDDGDMSFLDINFTIPPSMKTRKQLRRKTQSKKPRVNAVDPTKKKKQLRGKIMRNNTPGAGIMTLPVEITAEEDDCGYGDEFDDVVDEADLGHLIC